MRYCIVHRIELVNNELTYTPVGYLADMIKCDTLNAAYESGLGVWLEVNKSGLAAGTTNLSEYFNMTPVVYNALLETTTIEGLGLNEIIDISGL